MAYGEPEPFVLSLKSYDRTITYSYPSSDVNLDEVFDAVYALLAGATFSKKGILTHMRDWANEQLEVYFPEEVESIEDCE